MNKTDHHAAAIPHDAPFANELEVGARFYSQRLQDPGLYTVLTDVPFTAAIAEGGEPWFGRGGEPVWPEALAELRAAAVRTHRAIQAPGATHADPTPTPAVTDDQWRGYLTRAWRLREGVYSGLADPARPCDMEPRDYILAAAMQAAEQRAKPTPYTPSALHAVAEWVAHNDPSMDSAAIANAAKAEDLQRTGPAPRSGYAESLTHAADVEAAYREAWDDRHINGRQAEVNDEWLKSEARAKLAT